MTLPRFESDGWVIEYDAPATDAAYAELAADPALACGCEPCQNWARTRDRLHTPAFRELLDRFGIRPDREAEIAHMVRLAEGHVYGGWYHFVGRLLARPAESTASLWLPPFAVSFREDAQLVPPPFAPLRPLQLEFNGVFPWLSNVPEPDVCE